MQSFDAVFKGIEGKNAEIYLRNGNIIRGKVVMLDARTLNVLLNDADISNSDGYVLGHFAVVIIRGDQVAMVVPLA
jgi:small nuclear ribonucleoprotein (snRNP)-like protein